MPKQQQQLEANRANAKLSTSPRTGNRDQFAHAIQHFGQPQMLAHPNARSQENRLHRPFERALKTLAIIREERAAGAAAKRNTCENEPIFTGTTSTNPDKESSQW
jgi:hypothetical protein